MKETKSVFVGGMVMAIILFYVLTQLVTHADVICEYDQQQYVCDFSGLKGNYHTIKIIEDSMTTELK